MPFFVQWEIGSDVDTTSSPTIMVYKKLNSFDVNMRWEIYVAPLSDIEI